MPQTPGGSHNGKGKDMSVAATDMTLFNTAVVSGLPTKVYKSSHILGKSPDDQVSTAASCHLCAPS